MNNETLRQIIKQIKRYELTLLFTDAVEFKNWVSKLNKVQINNFLNLNIELEEVKNISHLLINDELLKCSDYIKRVEAISTLKNTENCFDLLDSICNPNFLHSKKFYKDIEMLSKAHTLEHCLEMLKEDAFINSPYHDEDLKLVVYTKDTNKEEPNDAIVTKALATVASNIDSINSKYHQEDMKLIATVGSDCLQLTGDYPECSINNLAIDTVSLSDKYHLENMKILATNPIAAEFLYILMTNYNIIKGKYYRKEIEALLNAKSKITARALYYYILNPYRKYLSDIDFLNDSYYDITDASICSTNAVQGSFDSNYLNNLNKINDINDKFVYHYVSLLMNPNFINSKYKNFDLELLQSISNKAIFMDLYIFMCNEVALNSNHHENDAIMISKSKIDGVRDLLLKKACNEYSINTKNHKQDMELISELQLGDIKEKIYFEIYYYLFRKKGMADPNRQEKLEKLLQGEFVERNNNISNYLDELELELDNNDNEQSQIVNKDFKPKTKILSLFKKYKR